MRAKFIAKCSVKLATRNSMKMRKCNIKRSFSVPPPPPPPKMTDIQAFVIHGSHSSVTIYYAKLPNSYLSEIAKHGAKYLQRSVLKQRIQLRRTKKYHMRHTAERVELFTLLAKLLWYLVSGKSHVGYLFNHNDNPLHKIVVRCSLELIVGTGRIRQHYC